MGKRKTFAGIDVGGTSMIAVIGDSKGDVLGSSGCATSTSRKPADVLDQITAQVEAAADAASVRISKLDGIGIGVPGAVDTRSGVVSRAPNLGWENVPLAKLLRKRFKKDVAVGNDVQVAILGEHAFGAASGAESAVGIWIGTGIGGGIILGGKLLRGSRGAAGEIGHTVLDENGPVCGCGRKGCAEAFASRTAMEREVRAMKGGTRVLEIMKEKNKPRMTSSVIARALEAKDPVMLDVFARAQHYIGLLTGNLINVLDPEVVVIGGGLAQRFGEEFLIPIRETARARLLRPDPEGQVRIVHAILGDYSGALGACALANEVL